MPEDRAERFVLYAGGPEGPEISCLLTSVSCLLRGLIWLRLAVNSVSSVLERQGAHTFACAVA